jgi:hypothetical protein
MLKRLLASAAVLGLVGCGSRHTARSFGDTSQDAVLVSRSPEFHEVTVDAGTVLSLTLENTVGSNRNRADDRVQARLSQPIVVDNVPVLPRGSIVDGIVWDVRRSQKGEGLARLTVSFNTLVIGGRTYEIATTSLERVAPNSKPSGGEQVGAAAAGEARLRSGERLTVRLARPVTIQIPVDVI